MEWLLILSAMLSAITGAFSGVREPEARLPQAEAAVGAQRVAAVAEQAAALVLPIRPAAAAFSTEVAPLPRFALAASIPLYADRLIE